MQRPIDEPRSQKCDTTPKPDTTDFWFGRRVLNSRSLATTLVGLVGTGNVYATVDPLNIAYTLTRRGAYPGRTYEDLERIRRDIIAPMPTAEHEITLPIADIVRFPQQDSRFLVGAELIKASGAFTNLAMLCAAIDARTEPYLKKDTIGTTLRVAEGLRTEQTRDARAAIARSGLFQAFVTLGPVEVCSSPAK